jgi:hypothetical protein
MKSITDLFIRRPVLSVVVNLIILIVAVLLDAGSHDRGRRYYRRR